MTKNNNLKKEKNSSELVNSKTVVKHIPQAVSGKNIEAEATKPDKK